jgi:mono/diheme cytochrome c family protein
MSKKLINLKKFLFILIISASFFNSTKSDEIYLEGKKIFLEKGNCAICHTLKDAGSIGNIGPNLNQIRPDQMRVIVAVTNGIGVMPAYEGQLSSLEIEAVAKYVYEASND